VNEWFYCVKFSLCNIKLRDWLGRLSLKWVGYYTLLMPESIVSNNGTMSAWNTPPVFWCLCTFVWIVFHQLQLLSWTIISHVTVINRASLMECKWVLVQVLSHGPSVGLSVGPSGGLWQNGWLYLDAIGDGGSAGNKDEAGTWGWRLPHVIFESIF